MNLPWRGGFLLIALVFQDPTPPPPDLVARYAEILSKGPLDRRELAARALLTLGRPGYEAFKRSIVANPDVARVVAIPAEPPPLSLVRFPGEAGWTRGWEESLTGNALVEDYPVEAETTLWKALDSGDSLAPPRARAALRELYGGPPGRIMSRTSSSLLAELNRRRTFEVSDRTLAEVLAGEPVSWILLAPHPQRITLKLRDVSLADFLRIATPDLAAVAVDSLLVLIPHDRVASMTPPRNVWAPGDLAPRLESALGALAAGDSAPFKSLTGVSVYNALRRVCKRYPQAVTLAEDLRKQLQQRVFFVDPQEEMTGSPVTLLPKGRKTADVLADFERLTQRAIKVRSNDMLDQRAPDFRFKDIPAEQAARALEFRLNYLR